MGTGSGKCPCLLAGPAVWPKTILCLQHSVGFHASWVSLDPNMFVECGCNQKNKACKNNALWVSVFPVLNKFLLSLALHSPSHIRKTAWNWLHSMQIPDHLPRKVLRGQERRMLGSWLEEGDEVKIPQTVLIGQGWLALIFRHWPNRGTAVHLPPPLLSVLWLDLKVETSQ